MFILFFGYFYFLSEVIDFSGIYFFMWLDVEFFYCFYEVGFLGNREKFMVCL